MAFLLALILVGVVLLLFGVDLDGGPNDPSRGTGTRYGPTTHGTAY